MGKSSHSEFRNQEKYGVERMEMKTMALKSFSPTMINWDKQQDDKLTAFTIKNKK